jgi:hypothetical protein
MTEDDPFDLRSPSFIGKNPGESFFDYYERWAMYLLEEIGTKKPTKKQREQAFLCLTEKYYANTHSALSPFADDLAKELQFPPNLHRLIEKCFDIPDRPNPFLTNLIGVGTRDRELFENVCRFEAMMNENLMPDDVVNLRDLVEFARKNIKHTSPATIARFLLLKPREDGKMSDHHRTIKGIQNHDQFTFQVVLLWDQKDLWLNSFKKMYANFLKED